MTRAGACFEIKRVLVSEGCHIFLEDKENSFELITKQSDSRRNRRLKGQAEGVAGWSSVAYCGEIFLG